MSIRFGAVGVALLVFGVYCSAKPDRPAEEKNSINALFDGLPKELTSKVKQNPVRIDRVDGWLRENVMGKGKLLEVRLTVKEIYYPGRAKDGTYFVRIRCEDAKINVLGDEWPVHIDDGIRSRDWHFSFMGATLAEAEKFLDAKTVHIKGKVKYALLEGGSGFFKGEGMVYLSKFAQPKINIRLENAEVDGKNWQPFVPVIEGGGVPAGGGKKKKGVPDPSKN